MLPRRNLFAALAVLAATSLVCGGCGGGQHDWSGVRLGMSAADIRDRFRPGAAGTWTSAQEPEPVLRWTATEPGASTTHAVFELHQGMLVALTLVGGPFAKGPALETTRASVAARRVGAQGPEVRVLSRDCETHRAEVSKLLLSPASP